MSRESDCYHGFMGTCCLNGCPCDDGYDGNKCECFIDKSERPSPTAVFDLHTGTWKEKNSDV